MDEAETHIWFCRKPAHGTFSKGPGSCRFIFLPVVIHNFLCFHLQIQEKQMTKKRWFYWLPKPQKMLHFFETWLRMHLHFDLDGHSSLSSEIWGTVGAWNIFTMKSRAYFVCTVGDGSTLDGVAWTSASDVFGVVWKELVLITSVFHTLLWFLLHSVA